MWREYKPLFGYKDESREKGQKSLLSALRLTSGTHLDRWEGCSTSRPGCTRPRWNPAGCPRGSDSGPRYCTCAVTPERSPSARRSPLSEVRHSR